MRRFVRPRGVASWPFSPNPRCQGCGRPATPPAIRGFYQRDTRMERPSFRDFVPLTARGRGSRFIGNGRVEDPRVTGPPVIISELPSKYPLKLLGRSPNAAIRISVSNLQPQVRQTTAHELPGRRLPQLRTACETGYIGFRPSGQRRRRALRFRSVASLERRLLRRRLRLRPLSFIGAAIRAPSYDRTPTKEAFPSVRGSLLCFTFGCPGRLFGFFYRWRLMGNSLILSAAAPK